MEILKGKTGIIMGIANQRSIASGIAEVLHNQGARLIFSHLPDEKGRMKKRIDQVVGDMNPLLVYPCDVNDETSIENFFDEVSKKVDKIDFFVHSIAHAPIEDIKCPTFECSKKGFLQAMETRVYRFIATTKHAAKMMKEGGSMVTLSYFGGEKVVGGYNLMGVAKSALESSVRYLAYELGPKNIRVNSISAGVIKTLAASAVGDFGDMMEIHQAISPLKRNVTANEVGKTALYLTSDLSSATTGENIHIDCGYNIMGSPGKAFERWGFRPRDRKLKENIN